MCFSATASFIAGGTLTGMAAITLKKNNAPSATAFAAIPLLFGLQQLCEGAVWLSLMHDSYRGWQPAAVHSFLVFSHALWPVWVPFSLYLMEPRPERKQLFLYVFALPALGMSLFELWHMFANPVNVMVEGHHIVYGLGLPEPFKSVSEPLYVVFAMVPCFLSGIRKAWLFGMALLVSVVASAIWYHSALVSVWCFFAAVLSLVIFYVLRGIPENRGWRADQGIRNISA
jgi:hypothetical protein